MKYQIKIEGSGYLPDIKQALLLILRHLEKTPQSEIGDINGGEYNGNCLRLIIEPDEVENGE